MSTARVDPSEFLSRITGEKVVVKMRDGTECHGALQSIDGFMNVALENTVGKYKGETTKTYGDVFIRGTNVLYIARA
ncbi:hypothetical protein PP7435_CHR3-2865 [Komagataella phaffii CBS 7435]|uniref:Sm domain-containing protein n=1 Tax=Komagataella phaffii (strain ATCC 76273 / CBS 7435 / CECT 11047 / NRRL Y-11430 / Wegner 21-1) TaxID=981350 RepID=A0A1G4KQN0_KOMPC|nr:hypothetical protein LJB42_004734 [Komagataella kurtzmanii]CAH2450294.1 Hypothetical protein BQ9382_C3-6235 [Komagataella phaffii CBS 7435]SCV12314.1 hypothetical protein PP7435_CHR3-2865 [Komagataella phaffii CBS 7435]